MGFAAPLGAWPAPSAQGCCVCSLIRFRIDNLQHPRLIPGPRPLRFSAFSTSPGCSPFAVRCSTPTLPTVAWLSPSLFATMGCSDSSARLHLRLLLRFRSGFRDENTPRPGSPRSPPVTHSSLPTVPTGNYLTRCRVGLRHTLASSPTCPAVSPFALRFGPVFASGPSPATLAGRRLPPFVFLATGAYTSHGYPRRDSNPLDKCAAGHTSA